MVEVWINGELRQLDEDARMPLLWVLRDVLGLTGTKYGCGIAQCGACTVLLDGEPTRACSTPLEAVAGRRITTIEGLAAEGRTTLQEAWITEDVPQCGYCQSGQLMSASALLARVARPTDEDIDRAMRGNLCRCGTYPRIRRAIHRAAAVLASSSAPLGGATEGEDER